MQVTIRNVEVEWNGKPPKKWGKAVVKYDFNGAARTQNIMSFANPEVFKKVQELVGETVEVEVGKNDKDFTEWRSISVSTEGSKPSATISTGSVSKTPTNSYSRDFETKEERARRQVLIVKQSSLSAAVATAAPGAKGALDQKTVLEIAQRYVDWVLEDDLKLNNPGNGFDNMSDDIPF